MAAWFNGCGYAHCYRACTEDPDDSSYVYIVDFTNGGDDWLLKDRYDLSVRPVALEFRP